MCFLDGSSVGNKIPTKEREEVLDIFQGKILLRKQKKKQYVVKLASATAAR